MDPALIRRLEHHEVAVWTDAVAAAPDQARERLGLSATPMSGGLAVRSTAVDSLLYNRAFGFGIESQIGPPELREIVAHYPREKPFTIQPGMACSWPGASAWLDAHGMRCWFTWVCWARPIDRSAKPPDWTHEVERVSMRDAEEFARACVSVHDHPETVPWLAALVGRDGWHHYLTRVDGEPAGFGVMFVRDDLAWLGWGGTLPAYRNRGIQTAVIARRLEDAAALGARWARVETADDTPDRPNPSFRNVRRAGFEILQRRPSHAYLPPEKSIERL